MSRTIASTLEPKDRICLPLDVDSTGEAVSLVSELSPYIGHFKIGFRLFLGAGLDGIRQVIAAGGKVFLDLKFHDIPNTVAGATKLATRLGVAMLNLHASGGSAMMAAALEAVESEAAKSGLPRPCLLAVTLLTSLSDDDVHRALGSQLTTREHVLRLARLAKDAGMDGVIASPLEAQDLRRSCGDDFLIVTPGVRPRGTAQGDQKRVMTPLEAIESGSDILVIGRPILTAANRVKAASSILDEIARGIP